MVAAQQQVHQHAQRVDVGGGGHVAALQLLGRGELRRERVAGAGGERRFRAGAGVVQQLGDAEVQQLHVAGLRHQDVAGLQVAVQHQAVVRLRHRGQDVQHQRQPLRGGQREALAVLVDGLAVDVLQHQVRLGAVGHDAGIEQARDVRVRQARQDAALALEARRVAVAEQARAQELDRHLALVAAVVAARQPHGAHAAVADLAHQRVGADGLSRQAGGLGQRRRGHELAALDGGQVLQHRGDGVGQLGIARPQRLEADVAFVVRQVQEVVEQRREPAPGLLADAHRAGLRLAAAVRAPAGGRAALISRAPRKGTAAPSASRAARCAR